MHAADVNCSSESQTHKRTNTQTQPFSAFGKHKKVLQLFEHRQRFARWVES